MVVLITAVLFIVAFLFAMAAFVIALWTAVSMKADRKQQANKNKYAEEVDWLLEPD